MENSKENSNSVGTPKPGEPKKALGRGLAALLGERTQAEPVKSEFAQSNPKANSAPVVSSRTEVRPETVNKVEVKKNEGLHDLPIEKISPNPGQPRKHFNQAQIEELANSLKEHGLIQPIVVRPSGPENYVIVAGERRYRAAKLAGFKTLPSIIKGVSFGQSQNDLAALVENIQRENLNPIDLATAYDLVLKNHGFSQDSLAQKLGVSRVSIANSLRLLKLPQSVRQMVVSGGISEGHARALLGAGSDAQMEALAQEILERGLSVREVENKVRMLPAKNAISRGTSQVETGQLTGSGLEKLTEVSSIEDELRHLFGTKVTLKGNPTRGSLEIYFTGRDSLNRILHQLRGLSQT